MEGFGGVWRVCIDERRRSRGIKWRIASHLFLASPSLRTTSSIVRVIACETKVFCLGGRVFTVGYGRWWRWRWSRRQPSGVRTKASISIHGLCEKENAVGIGVMGVCHGRVGSVGGAGAYGGVGWGCGGDCGRDGHDVECTQYSDLNTRRGNKPCPMSIRPVSLLIFCAEATALQLGAAVPMPMVTQGYRPAPQSRGAIPVAIGAADPWALEQVLTFGWCVIGIGASGIGAAATYFVVGTMLRTPEDRQRAGDGGFLTELVYAFTPSPWRKAYFEGQEEADEDKELFEIPDWQPKSACVLTEPEAVAGIKALQRARIPLKATGGMMPIAYWSSGVVATDEGPPPIMLVHGFDSSVLEFRYVLPRLVEQGLQVEACDWWTGGFSDRRPFLEQLHEPKSKATPWSLIREQLYEFWKLRCGGRPAIVVGCSLGGAAVIDFAIEHQEAVDSLVLIDAGGESYAQPAPVWTSLLAKPISNFFAWRGEQDLLPYPHLHKDLPLWRESLQAFLESGGYAAHVGPELIRTVPQDTLVLWGEEDDVLPVANAFAFEKDLPNCVGVKIVPDAQHAPGLENPMEVAKLITEFAQSRATMRALAAAD